AFSNGKIGKREVATRVIQALSESCDAERLAGSSADEKIDSCIWPAPEVGHVAEVRHVRVVVRQHGRGERLDLRERDRPPAERLPGDGSGLDAAAYAQVPHSPSLRLSHTDLASAAVSHVPSRSQPLGVLCQALNRQRFTSRAALTR